VRTRFAVILLEDEQFANLSERETQLLRAANELNPRDIFPMEQPKSAFGSLRPVEELLLFVEADGVHAQAGLVGHSADLVPVLHTLLEYTLESTSESKQKYRRHSRYFSPVHVNPRWLRVERHRPSRHPNK
jgi:hypothetical protein